MTAPVTSLATKPMSSAMGAAHDLIPGPDAGERSVHGDPARDALRVERGEGLADHVADVVGDEIGFPDVEVVEHAGDIAGLGLAAFRVGREAHAAQIRDDDRVVFRKLRRQGRPHVSGVGKAMQHDDGWTRTTDTHMDGGAAGRDILGAEVRRKGLNRFSSTGLRSPMLSSSPVESAQLTSCAAVA
jgi:hypothetical protein